MASNRFGNCFVCTTFGESHGTAIGVVIDGCPAGLALNLQAIQEALTQRAPGRNALVSPRVESDRLEVLSGLHEGMTTGAPLTLLIANTDQDSSKYEPIKDLLRPGHANYTYLQKYGVFDYKGGGRSSARETAARVAAGAVAKQFLAHLEIECLAYLQQVSTHQVVSTTQSLTEVRQATQASTIFCPEKPVEQAMSAAIAIAKEEGDSLGGIVAFQTNHLPVGLGDPVYEKLEANLAKAMLSIPASKGFEIGEGFAAAVMHGSAHNDHYDSSCHGQLLSNHSGGTLGGISTGMPLYGRVAFKPTSSIAKAQPTTTVSGEPALFQLPSGSRHDPCVAIRAVPVVEAMLALVLFDSVLMQKTMKLTELL